MTDLTNLTSAELYERGFITDRERDAGVTFSDDLPDVARQYENKQAVASRVLAACALPDGLYVVLAQRFRAGDDEYVTHLVDSAGTAVVGHYFGNESDAHDDYAERTRR